VRVPNKAELEQKLAARRRQLDAVVDWLTDPALTAAERAAGAYAVLDVKVVGMGPAR
jgi:hypothetical protein